MTHPFLHIDGVTKTYGDRAALQNASLEVGAGESVVIVGPSGCGKTTLLRVVAGLVKPDVGEVRLDGRLVSGVGTWVPPHERRLGFVFQDLALWPHLTARQNLDFVTQAAKMRPIQRQARAERMLRLVRIDALADRYPHQLSGGEQQRLALARALVGEPRLLLLDEPLSSLDPELRIALRRELRELQRELRLTMLYVTHDREDAAVLADGVVEVRAGRTAAVNRSATPGTLV